MKSIYFLAAMSANKQLQTVQLLVQLLPKHNLVLLECLLELLHKVGSLSQVLSISFSTLTHSW